MNVQHMKLADEFLQIINEVARLNFLSAIHRSLCSIHKQKFLSSLQRIETVCP